MSPYNWNAYVSLRDEANKKNIDIRVLLDRLIGPKCESYFIMADYIENPIHQRQNQVVYTISNL